MDAIRHQLGYMRSRLRPVFHWKYSGVLLPFFVGTGVAMVLANKFIMAYLFFALSGMWGTMWWLTSDVLAKKRKGLATRALRRNPKVLTRESRKHCAYEWGICAVILLVAGSCIILTVAVKRQYERDEVFQHLTASYRSMAAAKEQYDPMLTIFTLQNNSAYRLSGRYALVCYVNLAVGNHGITRIENVWEMTVDGRRAMGTGDQYQSSIPSREPLQSGGDVKTDQCLSTLGFAGGTDCIDVTLKFVYSLETQPNYDQEKDVRFVAEREFRASADRTREFVWRQESNAHRGSYCTSYLRRP